MTATTTFTIYRCEVSHRPDFPVDKRVVRPALYIAAATSKRRAFDAIVLAVGTRQTVPYARVTRSEATQEIEAALASPGAVLWRPLSFESKRFVRWDEPWQGPLTRPRTPWELYALRTAAKFEENGAEEQALALRDEVACGILTEGAFRESIGAALFRDVDDATFRRRVNEAVYGARQLADRGHTTGDPPLWLDGAERAATVILFQRAAAEAREGQMGQAERWGRLALARIAGDEDTFREALDAAGIPPHVRQHIIAEVYALSK